VNVLRTASALAEVGLALSPWAPAPKPCWVDELDAGWLTSVLAAEFPAARIVSIADRGGTSGTTDRRSLAVTWNAAGADAGLPERLFVKGTSRSRKNRTMVAALAMALQEVRFYEQVRPYVGDIAPRAYHARAGHGARFLLVLEDLGASGATPLGAEQPVTLEHARGVIDAFAQLHARFWRSPRLERELAWATPMVERPGFALLAGQFRRVRRRFLDEAAGRPLTPSIVRMLRLLNERDRDVYRSWSDGPQTLVHGDPHMGNTYARSDGRAGLLDWQVVFRTRGVREISYCLVPGLDTALRRTHERGLLGRYLDGLAAAGVKDPPRFEEAWADYRFFAHDAWDSVALTILWAGLHPPDALERAYRRCCAAVEDLAVDEILAERLAPSREAATPLGRPREAELPGRPARR
jgi:hypothetical protein